MRHVVVGQAEADALRACVAVERLDQLVLEGQHAAGMRHHDLAGRRRHHAARRALEEAVSELLLQAADAERHRGLTAVEVAGRRREAHALGDGQHHREGIDVDMLHGVDRGFGEG